MSQAALSQTVSQRYNALVSAQKMETDPAQLALVDRLDRLLENIQQKQLSTKSSSLGWLFNRNSGRKAGFKGLYIHGKVGRGKSMLMDIFYELAPIAPKRRVHFNEFMTDAHDRIHAHRKAFEKGETREEDPIKPVGRALAREARLLCFDEFTVTDIADAMILGRLFEVLFEQGTIIVATSNVEPQDLYHDGLNRQLFLPFIDLLLAHCDVFELDAPLDFRLGKITSGKAYLSPVNAKNRASMEAMWEGISAGHMDEEVVLKVKGRTFSPQRAAGKAAWFSFDQLCRQPLGANDYLAIADRFSVVFIENVPMMDYGQRNEAKRFILLIDTLYDNHITTVVLAAANPHVLYTAGRGTESFEFQRTASRLIEMQSKDYLGGSEVNLTE
ncbi:MAG: cell division protein ZapE [Pseudomonadota bacterium]